MKSQEAGLGMCLTRINMTTDQRKLGHDTDVLKCNMCMLDFIQIGGSFKFTYCWRGWMMLVYLYKMSLLHRSGGSRLVCPSTHRKALGTPTCSRQACEYVSIHISARGRKSRRIPRTYPPELQNHFWSFNHKMLHNYCPMSWLHVK